ncbi:MAG: hypothetical protein ACXQS8_06425 [Candidatus Helarchaeales archaeon]
MASKRELRKYARKLAKILAKRIKIAEKITSPVEKEKDFCNFIIKIFKDNPSIQKFSLPSSIVSIMVGREELERTGKNLLRSNGIGIKYKKMVPREVLHRYSRLPEVYTFYRRKKNENKK